MTSRPVRVAGSLAAVLGIGILVPALLVRVARHRFGGWSPLTGIPAPWHWSVEDLAGVLSRRVPESAVADALVRASMVVTWIAVATLMVTIAVEVVHQVRHDGLGAPPVRGLGWSQRVARSVAAGLLIAVSVSASSRVGAAGAALPARVPVLTLAGDGAAHGVESDRPVPTADSWRRASMDAVDEGTSSTPTWVTYTVQPGDSVYAIAARLAGSDPERTALVADAILERNLGGVMVDGQLFANAALIRPGWDLEVPAASRGGSPTPSDGSDRWHPRTVVVEPGDSLWSLAEGHLGEARRWTEIWDANAGTPMGGGRTFDDPDVILPGWRLLVGGVRQPAVTAHDVATEPDTAEGPSGPVAEPTTEEPADPPRPAAPTMPTVVPATTSGDTVTPAVPTTRPPEESVPVSTTLPLPVREPPNGAPGRSADPTPASSPSPLGLGQAAMLSAGLVALVGVVRRRRLRAARPAARIPRPSPPSIDVERRLRSIDSSERLLRLDLALRSVARVLADRHRRVVAAFTDQHGAVELLLSGPCALDGRWTGHADRWVLPATVAVEDLAASAQDTTMPCPTIVQLGVVDDGRDLFVDLEALGVLGVIAQDQRATAVITGLVATLESSVFAETTHLLTVGIDPAGRLGNRAVHVCESVDEAVDLATELVGSTATVEVPTFELRARMARGDAWEPAVVLVGVGAEMGPDDTLATIPPGIALVTACAVGTATATLTDADGAWVFEIPRSGSSDTQIRCSLTPIGVEAAELLAVTELLASSEEAPSSSPPGAPSVSVSSVVTASAGECADGPFEPPTWSLLVRLLGPVDVVTSEGVAVEFERSKARELVAWLATHRERSTRTAARTALWEADVRDATFANVVSDARRTMARACPPPEGREWLGRTLTEDLPLDGHVLTDAELVSLRLAAARRRDRGAAIETLRPAVELIRGLPFEGTSYLWPDAEGITSSLVVTATAAASELAQHYLAEGDVEGVFWATDAGLRVLAGHEALIALRMRAHAHHGDRAGVRREWELYERVLHADPWSDGEPSSKLVELRRTLL